METARSGPTKRREFDELIRGLRVELFRYAFWLCRDGSLAEDLVQETLVRGWRAFGSLKKRESAKQWLLTILRREHARHHERKRLEILDIDELARSQEALLASHDRPEVEDMRNAIFGLSDDYREPLVLQVLMGYSTKEIADIMNLTQGAVLTRLSRARKMLRNDIDERDSQVSAG